MTRAWEAAIAVGVLTLWSAPALAQSPAWGVEGGFSMSRVSPDAGAESITRGPGGLGGAWLSVQPWVPIGIQIEALYAQRHTHLTSSEDLKLDYFEVPILAKLKLFKSIYMLEGVAFGIPVSAKLTGSSGETDIKSTTRNPDIGLIIAGGVPVTKRASVEFRYEGAFTQFSTLPFPIQRSRSFTGLVRLTLSH